MNSSQSPPGPRSARASLGKRGVEWMRSVGDRIAPEGTRRGGLRLAVKGGALLLVTVGPRAFLKRLTQPRKWLPHILLGASSRNRGPSRPTYREWLAEWEKGVSRPPAGAAATVEIAVVIVVPPGEGSIRVERTARSLVGQTHPARETLIAIADANTSGRKIAKALGSLGSGIDVRLFPASTEAELAGLAIDSTTAPYLLLPRPGLRLRACALAELASALSSGLDAVFSDEDEIADDGSSANPFLKPGWSPDLLMAFDYVSTTLCLSRRAILAAGGVRSEPGLDWRYDLALRACIPGEVRHVPLPLASVQRSEREDSAAREEALRRFLDDRGDRASRIDRVARGIVRVRRPVDRGARVSAIIPTKDRADLLERCLTGLQRLSYPNLEIVVVDNGSVEDSTRRVLAKMGPRVVWSDEPFNFSRLINAGARAATGDYLLLLNNDTVSIDDLWLDAMLEQAQRPGVGVVGARLLYPWLLPQHEGVALVTAGGDLRGAHVGWNGYRSLDRMVRDVSAVTGACLMTPRSTFDSLAGFDEKFEVAFGDTDYCMRAEKQGYRVLYTPFAEVIHMEGASRGSFSPTGDQVAFDERWAGYEDHYYTPILAELLDVLVHRPDEKPRAGATALSSQFGVNLAGFLSSEKGIGEAARRIASTLRAIDVPLALDFRDDPASLGPELRLAGEPDGPIRKSYAMNLICINPDQLGSYLRDRGAEYLNGHYNVALWNWELEEIPAEWVRSSAAFDEIWAPSRFVAEPMARALPVPVHRVPYAVDVDVHPSGRLRRARFGIDESSYLFLFILDFHSICERKHPLGLVRAFQRAFDSRDDARLLVKTSRKQFDPRSYEAICAAARGHNILVVDEVLSRAEISALYSIVDAYVSLHRSEGFGLTLLEAMAAALPVVATGYGGNTDFMNASNSLLVDYEMTELERDYGPYRRGWRWADPDIDHAASLMRRLYERREEARALGEAARRSVLTELHPNVVGAVLKERLAAIRRSREFTRDLSA